MIDRKKLAEQFMSALPHARALGLHIVSVGEGEAEIEMGYAPHLVGDDESRPVAQATGTFTVESPPERTT